MRLLSFGVFVFLFAFTVYERPVLSSRDESCCNAPEVTVLPSDPRPHRMAFILGAQKSGTTFLFDELVSRHPKIKAQVTKGRRRLRVNGAKEPHFWHQVFPLNFTYYTRGFSLKPRKLSDPSLTFLDGTPDYLHIPTSACRISKEFPDAKFIILLRDPVARAMSHWNMQRVFLGRGKVRDFDLEVDRELAALRYNNCSFEASSAAAEGTMAKTTPWKRDPSIPSWAQCFRCQFQGGCTYSGDASAKTKDEALKQCKEVYPRDGYVRRGLYAYQIEHWLQFFSAKQFLILNHEQLQNEPEVVLDKAITFLGHGVQLKRPPAAKGDNTIKTVGKAVHKAFVSKSVSGWSLPLKDKTALEDYAGTLEALYEFYARSNEDLYGLVSSLGSETGWTGTFPASFARKDRSDVRR